MVSLCYLAQAGRKPGQAVGPALLLLHTSLSHFTFFTSFKSNYSTHKLFKLIFISPNESPDLHEQNHIFFDRKLFFKHRFSNTPVSTVC